MVQRFELELNHCNGGDMVPDEDGAYVPYEDYESLILLHMAEVNLIKDAISDYFDAVPNAGTTQWDLDKLELLNHITAISEGM